MYNKTNKYDTYISMLTAETFEEMEKIVGDLEEGRKIMDKLKELGLDDKYGALYDAEIVRKKEINSARREGKIEGKIEGKAEGKKETTTSIAKSMLEKEIDIPLISELTGLSKKQIARLM